MRQDEDAREPLHRLERERPLALEVDPAALAAGEQLGVARLGLGEPALGPGDLLLDLGRRAPDLLVRALEQLGQRQLDVRGDPLDLGEAIVARLVEEGRERVLVEPGRRLGQGRDRGQLGRRARGREVAEQPRLPEPRLAALGDLDGEEPLVDHLAEPIHDARPVEVDARRAARAGASRSVAPLPSTSSACAWVCRRIASNSGWPGVTHSRFSVSAASRSVEQRG